MTSDLVANARTLASRVQASAPSLRDTRIVLIDGPAGSGKTTLAAQLVQALGGEPSLGSGTFRPEMALSADAVVQTLHADDMYEGWGGLAGLSEVLVGAVIEPLVAGTVGEFRMWDWHRSERTHLITVPPRPVLIIEGVGVAMAPARAHASVVVWVEAPPQVCLERLLARDGEGMRSELVRWQQTESAHFNRDRTRAAADVIVTTSSV